MKGFIFSRTDSFCWFKLLLWIRLRSQRLHLKGIFFSWTGAMCLFNLSFPPKLVSQIMHLTDFFLSWTDAMTVLSNFKKKLASQKLFFYLWTDITCRLRWFLCKKLTSQRLHLKAFLFAWTYFTQFYAHCTALCNIVTRPKAKKSYHQQVLRWSLPLSLRIMKVKGSFERPTPPNTVPMHNLLIWYLGGK